jgi:hypothetical protein
MAALSNYAEKLLLDYLLTTSAVTRPTAWYVALFTSAPDDAGNGTEVSTGGYSRQVLTTSVATSGVGTASNTNTVSFVASGASYGTVTHVGIFTSLAGGNLLWHGPILVSKEVLDGDGLKFDPGTIIFTLA